FTSMVRAFIEILPALPSPDVNGISSKRQLPSRISAFSETDSAAGSVHITADSINIRDGAEINLSNQSSGNAGNLNLTARNIFLDSDGSLKAEVNVC
ncbi:MAG: hypothetical protein AAFY76_26940, partial [Cyanobacteria bacterium J06649_11]